MMDKLKNIWKSKTMLFSLLLMVFGAIELNFSLFQGLINDEVFAFASMIIGVIVAILRFVTTLPLDEK